jgi:prephenate dehydrogenase
MKDSGVGGKFIIGIIGGTGGMGQWFARFLTREGCRVRISGRKVGPGPAEMAQTCQAVVVSVPIGVTCQVIREVGPFMKPESLFMDLTSLKAEPVRAMLESSRSEVIGLHPLFGPAEPSLAGKNVAICPARGKKWLPWILELLKKSGARPVETTPERHDEIMALVQGINHLDTLVMGMVLMESGLDPAVLERFSTPILRTKMGIIQKVFSHPDLYAQIIALNPHLRRMMDLFARKFADLKGVVETGNPEALRRLIQRRAAGSWSVETGMIPLREGMGKYESGN